MTVKKSHRGLTFEKKSKKGVSFCWRSRRFRDRLGVKGLGDGNDSESPLGNSCGRPARNHGRAKVFTRETQLTEEQELGRGGEGALGKRTFSKVFCLIKNESRVKEI